MARTDSPQAPPGGWPAQRGTAEQDAQYWAHAPQPPAQPGQARPVPQGYAPAPAPAQRPVAPAADPYGHQAQGYYYSQPAAQAVPQPQRAQPGYAPQHDPYVAQQPPQQGYGAGYAQPQQGYAPPADPRQAAPAAHAQRPDLRGPDYDQWPQAIQQHDPRSYDLSSYMPPASRAPPQQQYTNDYAQPVAGQQPGYSDWGHQAGYTQDASLAQGGYDAGHVEGGALEAGYADEEAGYEFEDPPRRRKSMMIAAALVGAIVAGGGLAYAYQSLLGADASGPTPVVKSASTPSKVKPSDPGGKQFAHTDSKILGRLNDGSSSSEVDASGAKKVPTLVVGRDGSIIPPSAPSVTATVPVPGMTLVDVTGPAAATQTPAPAAAAAAAGAAPKTDTPPPVQQAKPVVVTPPAEPQKPVVIAKAEPAAAPAAVPTTTQSLADTAANAAAPGGADKAPVKPVKVAKLEALNEATDAAPAAAPAKLKKVTVPVIAATGAGYVAVLASVPASDSSRMDSLKQFADMQQKYGSALQNKTPDVQEANLGDKGKYHRLVVGPPGSKDAATTVCSELKSQGYTSCWITAY